VSAENITITLKDNDAALIVHADRTHQVYLPLQEEASEGAQMILAISMMLEDDRYVTLLLEWLEEVTGEGIGRR
jgi:hypothetical protein